MLPGCPWEGGKGGDAHRTLAVARGFPAAAAPQPHGDRGLSLFPSEP